jgi:hypothetical protein
MEIYMVVGSEKQSQFKACPERSRMGQFRYNYRFPSQSRQAGKIFVEIVI